MLAFDDTGAYRLLLPAMSEDPAELERFYETVEPLVAYDEQYETELVNTVETYLENDGNVAATAQQLFTHRHTIRYRLERARELCGHDVTSTEGREKLGLGLKSMRVLGIASPAGPAREPGRRPAGGPPRRRLALALLADHLGEHAGDHPVRAERSSAITWLTALIRARWVNACGKLPQWRPVLGSSSSA